MWVFLVLRTYEVTELKPVKAITYPVNVYTVFWSLLQEERYLHVWVCKKADQRLFFLLAPLSS